MARPQAPRPENRLSRPASPAAQQQRRGFWLRTLHQWHWISSALCLVGMLLFAATGITLNHASQIPATPVVTNRTIELPAGLAAELTRLAERAAERPADANAPLPDAAQDFFAESFGVRPGSRVAEWSGDEIYVSMPRPGGDA